MIAPSRKYNAQHDDDHSGEERQRQPAASPPAASLPAASLRVASLPVGSMSIVSLPIASPSCLSSLASTTLIARGQESRHPARTNREEVRIRVINLSLPGLCQRRHSTGSRICCRCEKMRRL